MRQLNRFLNWRGCKWLLLGLILAALVARFSFVLIGFSPTTNDPQSYYYNAESLAKTGQLDESGWWGRDYVAKFPYIYNYMSLLAFSMRFFGTGTLAIVALNTVFCLIGAGLLYFLFSHISKNRRLGLLAATLWLINPVEIVFSALPLPVVIVNAGLIAATVTGYFVLRFRDRLKWFLLGSLALGLILGLTNIFRPIMSVFLIALTLVYAVILIRRFRPHDLLKFAASLAVVYGLLIGAQNLALPAVEKITGYDNLGYRSGWSLLLGSNYESKGAWNDADNALAATIQDEVGADWAEYDRRLTENAIARYHNYTATDFLRHWFDKASILFRGPITSVEYELWNYRGVGRITYIVLTCLYLAALIVLLIIAIRQFIRRRLLPFYLPRSLPPAFSRCIFSSPK